MSDSPEPWLDADALRAARALGLSPEEYVDAQFAAERDALRRQVQQLRLGVQGKRRELQDLQASGASEDAIATMGANIERLLTQIAGLMQRYADLERRHDAARAALRPLDPGAAVDEAERVLRDESL